MELKVKINLRKNKYEYKVNFLEMEFETLKIEVCLSKSKLEIAISNINQILKNKGSATLNELLLLVVFYHLRQNLLFRAILFLSGFYNALFQTSKFLHNSKLIRED